MVWDGNIEGKFVKLRPVVESDAEFLLKLRLDPLYNRFLNPTSPSVSEQRKWIRQQRSRPGDYYFIIEDRSANPIGTVGIFDINEEEGTFEVGRWIIVRGNPFYIVLETNILMFDLGFNKLNLHTLLAGAQKKNKSVLRYQRFCGSEFYRSDDRSVYFRFRKDQFPGLVQKLNKYLIPDPE